MAKTYLTKLVRLLPHREMIMIQNRIRMQSYNFSVMHFQLDCLIPKMTPFPTYNNIWILPCSFQSLSNLFSFLIFHGNLLNVVTIWPHLSLQSFSFALLLTLLTHNKTQDGCWYSGRGQNKNYYPFTGLWYINDGFLAYLVCDISSGRCREHDWRGGNPWYWSWSRTWHRWPGHQWPMYGHQATTAPLVTVPLHSTRHHHSHHCQDIHHIIKILNDLVSAV